MERSFICEIWQEQKYSLISAPIPIKYFPEGTEFLLSLIYSSIKEGNCYDAWKFVALHFENGIYHNKGFDFYQSYSPVAHTDSFRINIAITDIHRLTARILDSCNEFQNKNVPIHERVCVSPPTYYLDWFERSYQNVPLNREYGPFCLQ